MIAMEKQPLWHEGKDINEWLDIIDEQYPFNLAINLWEDILCLKEDVLALEQSQLDNRQLAGFINELTLTASVFNNHQSLRENIAKVVKRTLKRS